MTNHRHESFGDFFRARRRELDVRQSDVAEACSVKQPAVSAWERGKAYPAPELLPILARLLKVRIGELADRFVADGRPDPRVSPIRAAAARRAELAAAAPIPAAAKEAVG